MKVVGNFVHGKWFCSESCAEQDPETQQINELYEKGIEFENNPNDDWDEEGAAADEDIDL